MFQSQSSSPPKQRSGVGHITMPGTYLLLAAVLISVHGADLSRDHGDGQGKVVLSKTRVLEEETLSAFCHIPALSQPIGSTSGSGSSWAAQHDYDRNVFYLFFGVVVRGEKTLKIAQPKPVYQLRAPRLSDSSDCRVQPCDQYSISCQAFVPLKNGDTNVYDGLKAWFTVANSTSAGTHSTGGEQIQKISVLVGTPVDLGFCNTDSGTSSGSSTLPRGWSFSRDMTGRCVTGTGDALATRGSLAQGGEMGPLVIAYAEEYHSGVYECVGQQQRPDRRIHLQVKPAVEVSRSTVNGGDEITASCNTASDASTEGTRTTTTAYQWSVQQSVSHMSSSDSSGTVAGQSWKMLPEPLEQKRFITLTAGRNTTCRGSFTIRVNCYSRSWTVNPTHGDGQVAEGHHGHKDITVRCANSAVAATSTAAALQTKPILPKAGNYTAVLWKPFKLCCCISPSGELGTWFVNGKQPTEGTNRYKYGEFSFFPEEQHSNTILHVKCVAGRYSTTALVRVLPAAPSSIPSRVPVVTAARTDGGADSKLHLFTCGATQSAHTEQFLVGCDRTNTQEGRPTREHVWSAPDNSSGDVWKTLNVHTALITDAMTDESDTVNITMITGQERQCLALKPGRLLQGTRKKRDLFTIMVSFVHPWCSEMPDVMDIERKFMRVRKNHRNTRFAGKTSPRSCLQMQVSGHRQVWYWTTSVTSDKSECDLRHMIVSIISGIPCSPTVLAVHIVKMS
eukprot:scpid41322/ scgid5195/ 